MKLSLIILFSVFFLASCGSNNSGSSVSGTEPIVLKDCSKIDTINIESSLNQNNPTLFNELFTDTKKLTFDNAEGACSEFFDYVLNSKKKLQDMKIITNPFKMDAMNIQFSTNENNFSVKEKGLIINPSQRFLDDGGKNFFTLLSQNKTPVQIDDKKIITIGTLSSDADFSRAFTIFGSVGMVIRDNKAMFSDYILVGKNTVVKHSFTLNLRSKKYPSRYLIECEPQSQTPALIINKCTINLNIDSTSANKELTCGLKDLISQFEYSASIGKNNNGALVSTDFCASK